MLKVLKNVEEVTVNIACSTRTAVYYVKVKHAI